MSLLRQVVVYSRKGCHLCEIVKETLIKLQRRGGFTWSEVDVDSDDELRRQFTEGNAPLVVRLESELIHSQFPHTSPSL